MRLKGALPRRLRLGVRDWSLQNVFTIQIRTLHGTAIPSLSSTPQAKIAAGVGEEKGWTAVETFLASSCTRGPFFDCGVGVISGSMKELVEFFFF